MKFATTLALTAAAAQLILAQPHGHAHHHHHRKHVQNVRVVKREMETTFVNEENENVSLKAVCAGLSANKIQFMDYEPPEDLCHTPDSPSVPEPESSPPAASEAAPASETTMPANGAGFYEVDSTEESKPETSPAEDTSDSSGGSQDTSDSSGGSQDTSDSSGGSQDTSDSSGGSQDTSDSSGGSHDTPDSKGGSQDTPDSSGGSQDTTPSKGDKSGGKGLDKEFPDGEIDCSSFPSDYGAMAVDYLGHGGWAGIQHVTIADNYVQDIVTGIDGDGCKEGAMCSYACPAGYLKSQWPATQGSTGQSVGGLECSSGKLRLTNPDFSKTLCVAGTGGVNAQNKAGEVVSICRTDYPGTESETIPISMEPGETEELACPDSDTYYKWKGMPTSAQYYLNPIGVGPEKACQWGEAGSKMGNWAPVNFGVSKKDGLTWLSIMQNKPTTDVAYEGTVEIKGDIVGSCKFENGQYCGDTGCNKDGCTVSLKSGEATYVIS